MGIAVRMINALGFIEVYGMVAGIEAADAMLKSAQVRILREHDVNPGQVSLVVEGDLAACRAAVNAGVAAASRLGVVISSHVIGRPDPDTETMILDMLGEPAPQGETPVAEPAAAPAPPPPAKPAPAVVEKKGAGKAAEAVETKAPVPARGKLGGVLAYIAGSKQGYSWKELKAHFPGLSQQTRKQLDAAVASGELAKTGARYRKP